MNGCFRKVGLIFKGVKMDACINGHEWMDGRMDGPVILVHKFAPSGVTFPQVHPRPSDGRRAYCERMGD